MSNITFSGNITDRGDSIGSHPGSPGEGGAVFEDGSLSITGSAFSNNIAKAQTTTSSYGGYGGALYVGDGGATITGTTFTSNTAAGGTTGRGHGGAIDMDGSNLILSGTTFTSNTAVSAGASSSPYGGALYTDEGGTTTDTTTFSGNSAPTGYGGAVYSQSAVRLLTSTLNGNTASVGGGVYSDGADAIVNSTIAGNAATTEGGGIYSEEVLGISSSTLVANTAGGSDDGGNLYLSYGQTTMHDSIIAGGRLSSGSGNENCFIDSPLQMDSLGYNLEDRNQCGLTGPGDKTSVAASALGSLGSNGGPTQTIPLLAGSPAIDAGDPAGCGDDNGAALAADQRGISRPQGSRCDIGSFELQQTPPPAQPAISQLKISPSRFAAQKHGATISKAKPQGTTVGYTDTAAATTTFTIVGSLKGYRAHGKGKCKALPRSGKLPKHAKKCTRSVPAGSFSHHDAAGANHFHFSGRLNGKGLAKGSYTATAVPRLSGLTGHAVAVNFKIV
jgi:predicted outer membrane repeat protein